MEGVSTLHTRPVTYELEIVFVIVPKWIIILDLIFVDLLRDCRINFYIFGELCDIFL